MYTAAATTFKQLPNPLHISFGQSYCGLEYKSTAVPASFEFVVDGGTPPFNAVLSSSLLGVVGGVVNQADVQTISFNQILTLGKFNATRHV